MAGGWQGLAHALEHLRDEGVITPVRGLGYFVRK
jgi:DNA-binding GntR family transcriptional regulator